MNNILTKYHALASWLLLALAALCVLFLFAVPLLGQHEKYQFELLKDGRNLQRLQALANSRVELERATQAFADEGLGDWVYSPKMPVAEVELAIQRRVSESFSAAGAQVQSIAPISVRNSDGYAVVGVRAVFSGELEAEMASLQELEKGQPLLLLDDISFTPSAARRGRGQDVAPQILDVQISVLAYLPMISEEPQ